LTLAAVLLGWGCEFAPVAISQQLCRLVLLYQHGGRVFAVAINLHEITQSAAGRSCGFFVSQQHAAQQKKI